MAQKRATAFCLSSLQNGATLHPLGERLLMPSALLVPFRGKKKAAKKQKKTRKDPKMVEMKEYAKRMEIQKLMLAATLKAVKKGEPLDPEMLNPARKRIPPAHSREEVEQRSLLAKEWSRFCMERHKQELALLQGMLQSRDRAMAELRRASAYLYCRALQLNPDLFPLECQAPTVTPPNPSYVPPDPEN